MTFDSTFTSSNNNNNDNSLRKKVVVGGAIALLLGVASYSSIDDTRLNFDFVVGGDEISSTSTESTDSKTFRCRHMCVIIANHPWKIDSWDQENYKYVTDNKNEYTPYDFCFRDCSQFVQPGEWLIDKKDCGDCGFCTYSKTRTDTYDKCSVSKNIIDQMDHCDFCVRNCSREYHIDEKKRVWRLWRLFFLKQERTQMTNAA